MNMKGSRISFSHSPLLPTLPAGLAYRHCDASNKAIVNTRSNLCRAALISALLNGNDPVVRVLLAAIAYVGKFLFEPVGYFPMFYIRQFHFIFMESELTYRRY